MEPRKQPFVNPQFRRDVTFIEANSSDVLIDLGTLTHILTKRIWDGPYQGWADVPVTWLGKASGMNRRRVRASLKRLATWGIITPMSTNATHGPLVLRYRYDLRRTAPKLSKEVEVRPAIKSDDKGAYGEIYVFDSKTWKMAPQKVSADEYAIYPVCEACSRVFHPTEGRGSQDNECAECCVIIRLRNALARGTEPFTLKSPFGSKVWTRIEMEEYLK